MKFQGALRRRREREKDGKSNIICIVINTENYQGFK